MPKQPRARELNTVAESAAKPLVARYSVVKLLGWIAASGAMAAMSFACASGSFGIGGIFALALGGIGTLFFGGIAVVLALRLFDRREQVIIDERGVFVRAHGDKRIGLRSIKRMHADRGRLSLYLFKPSKYPITRWHRRLIYRINGSAARDFFGDVWIWSPYLDHPLDAFPEAIWTHRPMTDFEKEIATIVAGWDNGAGSGDEVPAQK